MFVLFVAFMLSVIQCFCRYRMAINFTSHEATSKFSTENP